MTVGGMSVQELLVEHKQESMSLSLTLDLLIKTRRKFSVAQLFVSFNLSNDYDFKV